MLRNLRKFQSVEARARTSIRKYSEKSPLQVAFSLSDEDDEEKRYRTEKNPVIPNVENLSDRWLKMDAGQQDDIIAYLEDKARGSWAQFTIDEKRAINYIYFGPWGPRDPNAADSGKGYTVYAGLIGATTVGLVGYKLATDAAASKE